MRERRTPDRWQMDLFAQETAEHQVTLPRAVVDDLVVALADLVLEATGVRRSAGSEEELDDSEDHA
jgi:hypothetical protein